MSRRIAMAASVFEMYKDFLLSVEAAGAGFAAAVAPAPSFRGLETNSKAAPHRSRH